MSLLKISPSVTVVLITNLALEVTRYNRKIELTPFYLYLRMSYFVLRCHSFDVSGAGSIAFFYFITCRYCIIPLPPSLPLLPSPCDALIAMYASLLISPGAPDKGHNRQSALVRDSRTPLGVSLREEKERAVTYQELRHAEGTSTGKAQAPVDRKGLQDAEGGRAGGEG